MASLFHRCSASNPDLLGTVIAVFPLPITIVSFAFEGDHVSPVLSTVSAEKISAVLWKCATCSKDITDLTEIVTQCPNCGETFSIKDLFTTTHTCLLCVGCINKYKEKEQLPQKVRLYSGISLLKEITLS